MSEVCHRRVELFKHVNKDASYLDDFIIQTEIIFEGKPVIALAGDVDELEKLIGHEPCPVTYLDENDEPMEDCDVIGLMYELDRDVRLES